MCLDVKMSDNMPVNSVDEDKVRQAIAASCTGDENGRDNMHPPQRHSNASSSAAENPSDGTTKKKRAKILLPCWKTWLFV